MLSCLLQVRDKRGDVDVSWSAGRADGSDGCTALYGPCLMLYHSPVQELLSWASSPTSNAPPRPSPCGWREFLRADCFPPVGLATGQGQETPRYLRTSRMGEVKIRLTRRSLYMGLEGDSEEEHLGSVRKPSGLVAQRGQLREGRGHSPARA